MIGPLALMLGIAMIVFALIFFAKKRFKEDPDALEQVILQTLPQTQCAQCGYPGCRPYAQAIAAGEAINRCPPGRAYRNPRRVIKQRHRAFGRRT